MVPTKAHTQFTPLPQGSREEYRCGSEGRMRRFIAMPSKRSLEMWPTILALTAFTGLALGGQHNPPEPPPQSIREGRANQVQPPAVNRPVPQQPRPALRPATRPGARPGT